MPYNPYIAFRSLARFTDLGNHLALVTENIPKVLRLRRKLKENKTWNATASYACNTQSASNIVFAIKNTSRLRRSVTKNSKFIAHTRKMQRQYNPRFQNVLLQNALNRCTSLHWNVYAKALYQKGHQPKTHFQYVSWRVFDSKHICKSGPKLLSLFLIISQDEKTPALTFP